MEIACSLYDDGRASVELTRDGRRPLAQLLVEQNSFDGESCVITLTPEELRELGMFAVDLAADLIAYRNELAG